MKVKYIVVPSNPEKDRWVVYRGIPSALRPGEFNYAWVAEVFTREDTNTIVQALLDAEEDTDE